ncbi:phosphopantetheine-binding protein [Pseudomonadota bacterium]
MSESLEKLKLVMVEHLKHVTLPEKIEEDVDLEDLGLDSMSAMNLMFDIEDQFDVAFDESLMTPEVFKTTGSLHEGLLSLLVLKSA